MRRSSVTLPVTFLSMLAGLMGAWLAASRLLKRKGPTLNYPENVLEDEGAVSAVTGGHPEEMNEMPPNELGENPVFDGSDLDIRRATR